MSANPFPLSLHPPPPCLRSPRLPHVLSQSCCPSHRHVHALRQHRCRRRPRAPSLCFCNSHPPHARGCVPGEQSSQPFKSYPSPPLPPPSCRDSMLSGTPMRLTVPKSPNLSTSVRASSRASVRDGSASCDTSFTATPRQTPRSARQQASGALKRNAPAAAAAETSTPVKPVLTVPQVSRACICWCVLAVMTWAGV